MNSGKSRLNSKISLFPTFHPIMSSVYAFWKKKKEITQHYGGSSREPERKDRIVFPAGIVESLENFLSRAKF